MGGLGPRRRSCWIVLEAVETAGGFKLVLEGNWAGGSRKCLSAGRLLTWLRVPSARRLPLCGRAYLQYCYRLRVSGAEALRISG